ncbi:MAG: hypothetical protein K0U84_01665 [Actinomycetia bacterium]|nr:hypothetical protein [Actinomycetes bacterium]
MPVVRAKEPFAYTDTNGVPRTVRTGDLFNDNDPCVRKRPHLFETVEVAASRATETASAAPGEVRAARSTPRKAAKAAAKSPAQDDS